MEIFYVDSDIICSADNMHLLKENALIYSKSSTPFDYLEKLKSVPIIIMVIIRHIWYLERSTMQLHEWICSAYYSTILSADEGLRKLNVSRRLCNSLNIMVWHSIL